MGDITVEFRYIWQQDDHHPVPAYIIKKDGEHVTGDRFAQKLTDALLALADEEAE